MIAKKQIKMIKNAILCDLACYFYALCGIKTAIAIQETDCNRYCRFFMCD